MKSLKVTLPILAFFSLVLTAYSEEFKKTNERESSVNQFLEKENRALREIIANAVNAGLDWDGEFSDKMRVRITASDGKGLAGLEWSKEIPPGGFLMGQDGGPEVRW